MGEDKNYYLVRSSRDIPWDESVIGVGWDDYPFCKYSDVDKLIADIREGYGPDRRANQIRRYKSIKKGDVIVVPTWGAIVVAIAGCKELYDSQLKYRFGSNQRCVSFFKDKEGEVVFIPRDELSNGLQKRCRIQQTIADLSGFSDELDQIISQLEAQHCYSWNNSMDMVAQQKIYDLKNELLKNIQDGRQINLKAGGIGLENLVKELLEIDGFSADVLSKRAFAGIGDADIVADKMNFLGDTEAYLVQVKHHAGNTSGWGVEQLAAIQENKPKEFQDHTLVLITSGEISDVVRRKAQRANDIRIVDGKMLVEWIFNSLPALGSRTKRSLGILELPYVLSCGI